MKNSIQRKVSIATALASSSEIPYASYERGQIIVPAGSSITGLTWYVAEKVNGTFIAAYSDATTAVEQTVEAGRAYSIPSALAGAASLKAVGDAAGDVYVNLKG